MDAFTSLAEVQRAVAALPPPAPGKVRVFRGQTDDYPAISPAAYRRRLERSIIWQVYSRDLLSDITERAFAGHLDEKELQVFGLWLDAVAQHYGSGSRYLDASQNVESALWFALHRGQWVSRRSVLGPPGPPSPYDLPAETQWLDYAASVAPGFLYAFDVDVWDGTGARPPDLALVDLNRAPEPFRTPRMQAQQGCLVLVSGEQEFDLRPHRVAGTPLSVAWPMTGSLYVRRNVEQMFPPPSADPWYRRFLSIPMSPDINPSSGEVVLRRPLPVTLYRGETQQYNDAVADTESFLYPALIHRALAGHGGITGATPILLEAPLLHVLPPADDSWNHELLLQDLPDSVPVYDSWNSPPAGTVGLRNVLFQFSNFEETFWERGRSPAARSTLTRAIWITRGESGMVAVLLTQQFPGTQVAASKPALVRLGANRRIQIVPDELSILAKPLFVALHLLRALSPQPKAEAAPRVQMRHNADPPEFEYLVAIVRDAGRLIRARDPAQIADWYVMRGADGDPYTQSRPTSGSLHFRVSTPFADIPAAQFQCT